MSREGRRVVSLRRYLAVSVGPLMNPVCNVPALKGVAMVNLFHGRRSVGH
jgi:hypothetical protein